MRLAVPIRLKAIAAIAVGSADGAQAGSGHQPTESTGSHTILVEQVCSTRVVMILQLGFLSATYCAATLFWTNGDQTKTRDALADPSTSAGATLDHQSDMFAKPTTGQRPQSLIRCDQIATFVLQSSTFTLSWSRLNSIEECWLCLQAPSPDGSAVLENSEQFQVHLKAAIMDPRVKEYADQPFYPLHCSVVLSSLCPWSDRVEQRQMHCSPNLRVDTKFCCMLADVSVPTQAE